MRSYYNEFDPKAAAWLRELIAAGEIPPGDVDERDIRDILPSDLTRYTQCHFFAGIGGWPLALRYAGVPASRALWTGSCPCQPFSAAGKRGGAADERHLWPHWHHLIEVCRPPVVFGEQVASADGLEWLDLVSADLEASGYSVGAADLCSAGVGAPHIRQRLHFGAVLGDGLGGSGAEHGRVADSDDEGCQGRPGVSERADQRASGANGVAGGMADSTGSGREPRSRDSGVCRTHDEPSTAAVEQRAQSAFGRVANAGCERDEPRRGSGNLGCQAGEEQGQAPQREWSRDALADRGANSRPGPHDHFWRACDWLLCRDDKWRPVEPGLEPLAHGVPGRVGLLRGYGNAINPWLAAEFIQAFEEARLIAPPPKWADLPLWRADE